VSDLRVDWNQRCLAVPAKTGVLTAVGNRGKAYTAATGRTATATAATSNVAVERFTGSTPVPSVYEWKNTVKIPTDLSLNFCATDAWSSTFGENSRHGHC